MVKSNSLAGKERSWLLLDKLGEGDAGEVYLVESMLDQQRAILKRPRSSAFSSDVVRQASQIANEAQILKRLSGMVRMKVEKGIKIDLHTPRLLDQSPPGTEFSDRFFIVMEQASGFALTLFERISRFGMPEDIHLPMSELAMLNGIAQKGEFPRLVLLRVLAAVLQLFDQIHPSSASVEGAGQSGVLWNDVKPDHLFWDPNINRVTIIDWGNAQFLEPDGSTKDRRLSRSDDYNQFFEAFGTLLANNAPELGALIKWPVAGKTYLSKSDLIKALRASILKQLSLDHQALQKARQSEQALSHLNQPVLDDLIKLLEIQNEIANFGEVPNYSGSELFCNQLASLLTANGNLDELIQLCQISCPLQSGRSSKWKIINQIAEIAKASHNPSGSSTSPPFIKALSAVIVDDWPTVLWELLDATRNQPEQDWWYELTNSIRTLGLNTNAEQIPPLIALRRTVLSMQSNVQKLRDKKATVQDAGSAWQTEVSDEELASHETLASQLKMVASRWDEVDPDPPYSDLRYRDLFELMDSIRNHLPAAHQLLSKSLEQPEAHVRKILEAWSERDFLRARQGLRWLLLWDPDRRRALLADRAILTTPAWLSALQKGPQNGQTIQEFATAQEFTGRELRQQVGPAEWLDSTLIGLSQLRKNRRVGELLSEMPVVGEEMPWLEGVEPRKYTPASQAPKRIPMERVSSDQLAQSFITGVQTASFGVGQDVLLADPLDTWAPEARGSSARTFNGFLRAPGGQVKQMAVKFMRPDRLDYALPLFREEALVLTLMRDVPGITPLIECGFLQFDKNSQIPPDNRSLGGRDLTGTIERYGPDDVQSFLSVLENRSHKGDVPYLITPKRDNQENLMWLCDSGYTRGRFLPIEEAIRMAVQICDILEIAHQRNIVYRDHKLLHYYWSELYNGIFMIDWNVARYHPQGLSQAEIQFDLVQLGARAIHHIFTGRVAPGALADGPNRVDEIEKADHSYKVMWTYDDQRLPPDLKEIIEQLLTGGYTKTRQLRQDLEQVYTNLFHDEELAAIEEKNEQS